MTHRLRTLTLTAALALTAIVGANAQQSPDQNPNQSSFTLKVNSDLVLTNVVVRDRKTGEVVRGQIGRAHV